MDGWMDGWMGGTAGWSTFKKKREKPKTRLNESTRRVVMATDDLPGIKTIILIGVPLAYMQPNPNATRASALSLCRSPSVSVCQLSDVPLSA